MHFKHYENPYSGLAQYVNCAAANSGADAGMYDASSEIYKLSTVCVELLEYFWWPNVNSIYQGVVRGARKHSEKYKQKHIAISSTHNNSHQFPNESVHVNARMQI